MSDNYVVPPPRGGKKKKSESSGPPASQPPTMPPQPQQPYMHPSQFVAAPSAQFVASPSGYYAAPGQQPVYVVAATQPYGAPQFVAQPTAVYSPAPHPAYQQPSQPQPQPQPQPQKQPLRTVTEQGGPSSSSGDLRAVGLRRSVTYVPSAPVRQAMSELDAFKQVVVRRRETPCCRRFLPCLCCCCPLPEAKFDVRSTGDKELFLASEEYRACSPCLCCRRGFSLELTAAGGERRPVLTVQQPCTCCLSCPMCCEVCRPRAEVNAADGERTHFGHVFSTWSCCKPRRVFLRDRVGRKAFTAARPESCCRAAMCCSCLRSGAPFAISTKHGKESVPGGQIAPVTRDREGRSVHRVDFPDDATGADKLLVLAAALLLDQMVGV